MLALCFEEKVRSSLHNEFQSSQVVEQFPLTCQRNKGVLKSDLQSLKFLFKVEPGLYVGFIVVIVTPTPLAPKKAIGNSGMFGTTMPITSPFFAPNLNKADPNLRAIPVKKTKYRFSVKQLFLKYSFTQNN